MSSVVTFSVVVNTTDRAKSLQTLLLALEQQSYPHFEVIVVVGPTRDDTMALLARYERRVQVIRCPKRNLSQSRNIGLMAAVGDVVAYIDDDAVPCRRWLEQLALLFADPSLDGAGGSVYLVHPASPEVQFRIGVISSLAEQVDARTSWLHNIVPPGKGIQWLPRMMGANMAFRRQALLEVGGFDEFYSFIAEDPDIVARLVAHGKTVHPVEEAVVYHVPASSHNRVVFSFNVRWWMQTRSIVYYSIKNGRDAGDSNGAILLRCLQFPHGHWMWSGQLYREGKITWKRMLRMRFEEVRALMVGGLYGLCAPRQLRYSSVSAATTPPTVASRKYQNAASSRQPAIDPVSGYHGSMTMTESPMRICLLSPSYPPLEYDGIGRLTHLMARGLFERGHTVHVLALAADSASSADKEQITFYDGAYVHRSGYLLSRYNHLQQYPGLYHAMNRSHSVYEKIRRLMANDGIQIVDSPLWLAEGLVTCLSGLTPVVVRLVTAQRQVAAIHHDVTDDMRLKGEMEHLLLERATHLLSNTQATLESVRQTYHLQRDPSDITIVPYGIAPCAEADIRPYAPAATHRPLTILFVGRLEKRKGIRDLFQAIPAVLQHVPGTRFVLAGSDNSKSDGFLQAQGCDYKAFFAQQHPDLVNGADPVVTFTGAISDAQLQRYYQSCDLFVAPSLYESFGLVYLEAMNYAKPVIGCRSGGVPEVVEDGVTGLLVTPESPQELVQAMVTLLGTPARLREMGLAGRQRLLDRFTLAQMALRFEQAYRKVIDR